MSYHDCENNCGATDCPAPVKIIRTTEYGSKVFGSSIYSSKAKWWELWLAIIFGERCIGEDNGLTVIVYFFRGKYYLTNTKKAT